VKNLVTPFARTLVLTDADNTLWDTNQIFEEAQLWLLSAVEKETGRVTVPDADRLSFVRDYDQEFSQRHHAGLSYPPKFLIRALALGLEGITPASAAQHVWSKPDPAIPLSSQTIEELARKFDILLSNTPVLRPGVLRGLEALRSMDCQIVVVTEGSKNRCQEFITYHSLTPHIDRIIAAPKCPELFFRVEKLVGYGVLKFMIGDQIGRDIAPAIRAGFLTIFFPGGFKPKWEDQSQTRPDFVISSFDQAAAIVESAVKKETLPSQVDLG
jgi:putative hydrolase of the HAD superfamily